MRINGKKYHGSQSTRELYAKEFGIQAQPNRDNRRVNMYAAFAARGEAVPFHLANDESFLSQFSDDLSDLDLSDISFEDDDNEDSHDSASES